MAGSYRHLVGRDGKFTFDLIDNLGDAYEACEECFDIIEDACDAFIDLLAWAEKDGASEVDMESMRDFVPEYVHARI